MAIKPGTLWPTQTDVDANYPLGKAKNVVTTGDGTGTPLVKDWVNDLWGYLQYKLSRQGINASGAPDQVGTSDYMNADDLRFGSVGNLRVLTHDPMSGTLTGKSIATQAEETLATNVAFSTDGLRMFVIGSTNDSVFQYNLSTAWDLSTAVYSLLSVSFAAQQTTAGGIAFKPDGLSMYISGSVPDAVHQYTLSVAWDISTAVYAAKTISVTAQDVNPYGVKFNPTGTKMYMSGQNTDAVYHYILSTPWDLATASHDGVALSIAAQTTNGAYDCAFSVDGKRIYVLGGGRFILEYALPTAYVLTGAVFTLRQIDMTGAFGEFVRGMEFGDSGKQLFLMVTGSDRVQSMYATQYVSAL